MSLISIDNFSNKQILSIINKSIDIHNGGNLYPGHSYLNNHIFAILFFEPSTRTKLSFESAIYRCKGNVIHFDKNCSSCQKGESFEDTIKTIDKYCDLLIIRHSHNNIFDNIKSLTNKPVINAGNGSYEHPTQSIIDATTIFYYFNKYHITTDTPQILIVGDLSHSRTVNSFIKCLHKLFPQVIFYCIPSKPENFINYWNTDTYNYIMDNNVTITEINSYDDVISYVDVVYITRPQNERHDINYNSNITMTPDVMNKMKKDSIVLHPMPRNDELSPLCDNNHRAVYFKQAELGIPVRRVILEYLMGYIKL